MANPVIDVLVVGAGPAGAATAAWCARAGLEVAVLEKSRFPRDKICGDGLTPRAVGELQRLGVNLDGPQWHRIEGLRLVAGDRRLEIPWPQSAQSAKFGLTRARLGLDHALVEHARELGASVHEGWVAKDVIEDPAGRVIGVRAQQRNENGRKVGSEVSWRARVVVSADGVAARTAVSQGRERMDNRPLGVAVRSYAASDRSGDSWMESHLELRSGEGEHRLLPGYGWIFPLGDGTANIGLGSVHSSPAQQSAAGIDYKRVLGDWRSSLASEWGPLELLAPARAAALPMAFNRKPLYADGLMLVGDAGGMVSPFNGEGIAYGLQAGRIAAHAISRSLGASGSSRVERILGEYSQRMSDEVGGYFTLGRTFVRLIENPAIMRVCTQLGMRSESLMKVVVRLLADSYEPHGGDVVDRALAALARVVPKS